MPIPQSSQSFDKNAAYRFSLAFQCVVNIGVRGSENIRGRVSRLGHSMLSDISWRPGWRTRDSPSGPVSVQLECLGRRVSNDWPDGALRRNKDRWRRLLSWREHYRGRSQWNISAASSVLLLVLSSFKMCVHFFAAFIACLN